jgi:hypothetical protein
MDKDLDAKTSPDVSEDILSWRKLDDETIEILIDDKIATGG